MLEKKASEQTKSEYVYNLGLHGEGKLLWEIVVPVETGSVV